jgi:hypothetical protein
VNVCEVFAKTMRGHNVIFYALLCEFLILKNPLHFVAHAHERVVMVDGKMNTINTHAVFTKSRVVSVFRVPFFPCLGRVIGPCFNLCHFVAPLWFLI